MNDDIHVIANGRWPSILTALGVEDKFLRNRHGPCPMCGGKDRYRFDDKDGMGTFYCSKCGAGTGIDLVMRTNHVDFKGAVKLVRGVLPQATASKQKQKRSDKQTIDYMRSTWNTAKPAAPGDDTGRYLRGRGLVLPVERDTLRTHPGLEYRDQDGKVVASYPCMLAAIRGKGGKPVGVHRTWIANGKKAPVQQPKKSFGKLNPGCAIRLYHAEHVLGVAEGIETAIAAHMLFNLPVWSLISAGQMEKFDWPQGLKRLVIFGDKDASFTGQKAAYTLAYRAKAKGIMVDVELPNHVGEDWADYL